MKPLFTSLLLLSLFILTACNGSSGENDTLASDTDVIISNLTLKSLNSESVSQQSFENNELITVQALVLDQNGDPVNGKRVNFTTDLGALSVSSKLTNDQGIAEISISNNSAILSAGTLSASVDELTASIDYEYISSSITSISSATLTSQMLINGEVTNRFKVGESVQVVATLLDENGDPFSGQIINANADIGDLSSAKELTNNNGRASFELTAGETLGAGVVTLSFLVDDTNISSHINYGIVAANSTVEDNIRLGYFDENDNFIEGKIKLSIDGNTISAGGTLAVSVALVDANEQRINTPTSVSFTSTCVTNDNATIDLTVFSIKGNASATYEDIKCAGANGTEDIIQASITTNGITHTASEVINITGEELGSIEFLSAEPNSIVLKGSGGQETSILTFVVKSALGNVIAQQDVDFSLSTTVGGISLGRASGITNSLGQVTTQVLSGTVPTTVTVTAKATSSTDPDISIQTQSSQLSINTGLAEQTSITIAASILNPEASTVGTTSQISVWLADSFNNPVPDGTSANFTTEGGSIGSQCLTVNGTCSVEWRAVEPYLDDHRSTILVTANGHETFYDTNGNNTFDDEDGSAITDDTVSSGLGRRASEASGFIDMSEAWRDDNENNVKDATENIFIDDDGDGAFSEPDGMFNGPQCEGSLCDANAKVATIRKALVLIMSDANDPIYELTSGATIYANNEGVNDQIPSIADGESRAFSFKFADSAMQTLPFGTVITVEFSGGTINGTTSYTVSNTLSAGFKTIDFILKNEVDGEPEEAILEIKIDTNETESRTYFSQTITME